MVGTILLILFFALLIGFLVIPIQIRLDTIEKLYFVQLQGLAKASIEGDKEELLRIRLQIFFRSFYFYPLRKINASRTKKVRAKKQKKLGSKMSFKTASRLLNSFKVKEFVLNIDTGNFILNAKLYPAFAFLNYHIGNISVNFEGRNQMVLYLQNRPIYILKSFINI